MFGREKKKELGACHVLWLYLKERRRGIFLLLTCVLFYWIVFGLSNVAMDIVVYAMILLTVVCLVYMAYDFYDFYKRWCGLVRAEKNLFACLGELPESRTPLEETYQNLIWELQREKDEMAAKQEQEYKNMVEYYTLWAHQIKTPIAAMRLLLQDGSVPDKEKELEQELFRTEQYVEMALHYLRLGDMSSDLLVKQYDLYEIVKQALRKYAAVFIYKRISLDMEEFHCNVITDEKWLQFVLEQLLSNALKYTQKGKVSVYLDGKFPKTLVIEDTGAGIREEDLPRIFERGFTGYNGRDDKRSTGIGLYLCRRILQRLGHPIRIESKKGMGTRVFIDLSQIPLQVE